MVSLSGILGQMNEINLFGPLLDNLRAQVETIKQRCLKAEAQVAELEADKAGMQERTRQLEEENRILTEKYQNLRAGTASVASAEEIEDLRSRYLAMIREIDECIDKLDGKPKPLPK